MKRRAIGYATLRPGDQAPQIIERLRQDNTEEYLIRGVKCDFVFVDRIARPFSQRPELQKFMEFVRRDDDVFIDRLTDLSFNIREIHYKLRLISVKGVVVNFVDVESAELFNSFSQGLDLLRSAIRLDDLIKYERNQFELADRKLHNYSKRGRPEKVNLEEIFKLADHNVKISIPELIRTYQISRSRAYEIRRLILDRRATYSGQPGAANVRA